VKPLSYDNKPLSYDDKPLSYNDPPLSYDDKPLSYDDKPLSYNDPPLSYILSLICVQFFFPLNSFLAGSPQTCCSFNDFRNMRGPKVIFQEVKV
jgi:hypothetical protein